MRGFWLLVHVLGFTLWLGGGIATMVAGVTAKRLGQLHELVPRAELIGVLVDPISRNTMSSRATPRPPPEPSAAGLWS